MHVLLIVLINYSPITAIQVTSTHQQLQSEAPAVVAERALLLLQASEHQHTKACKILRCLCIDD